MPDETILEEAQRIVHGNRGADYGHPIEDFTRSGRIWGAILGIPDVPPDKVAMCLIGVKLSREVNRDKRDNRVDMAGYAETLDMVRQRQEEQRAADEKARADQLRADIADATGWPFGQRWMKNSNGWMKNSNGTGAHREGAWCAEEGCVPLEGDV